MVGLVTTTIVVAMREKKERAKLAKEMAPPPMDDVGMGGADPMQDGFGEPDPVASFDPAGADEIEPLDENAFN